MFKLIRDIRDCIMYALIGMLVGYIAIQAVFSIADWLKTWRILM